MCTFIYFWHMLGQVAKDAFTSPLFVIIYILLVSLITWQYLRLGKGERSALVSSLFSAGYGLLGGVIGSLLLMGIGIDLALIGISYLWIAAVILMLLHPRYLCFAYAGGVVGLISLLFGYPPINIPHLMALVAVLHLVESILIYLNGHFNPVPLTIEKKGEKRKGFNLQKFWPLPLLALISTGYSAYPLNWHFPDWWPLLGPGQDALYRKYQIVPVLVVLGYGEITYQKDPREKARFSSRYLLLFSLFLLFLSWLASRWEIFIPLAVLASPLGHEIVIWLGMRREGEKIFNYRECSLFIYLMNRLRAKKS
ncbi:hypothetical protein SAMN02745221_00430 [Thermosyntropha lipolytica DSM 11003]|uniref:Uncharacterized protein n=1 Tax=Thermosyntropha lipolytica DSM 11003 TaxID=1123382 RepID=A0A1M5KLR1_9FIRM|nr:hypothetical protein [Thermosyntropha lipolytica]SHG53645.1 hypothetical protein SAMN02745221_00430 [Thermosyntropha lipolytica DSM 11003]